jgi:hypothetical protein
MLAVTASDQGFVAVGTAGTHPAAWSSADGREWAPVVLPVPAGARSAALQHVAGRGRQVTAAGTAATPAGPVPFAAVSEDGGQTWREVRLPAPACPPGATVAGAPGRAAVTALAAGARGFVATGTCGSPGLLDVVIWSSRGGRTWTVASPHRPGLSGPGAQQITSLTVAGGLATGTGYTATPDGSHPTLWQVRMG